MTDKQLQALSKTELLKLLHQQEVEIERLTQDNEKLSMQNFNLENVGSIAEASLLVSGIMQSAQSAANVYLESIRKVEVEKLENIARLEEIAKARAQKEIQRKNAEEKAHMERLIIDVLRNFDNQLNRLTATKDELTELINRNELQYLLPENYGKSTS